MKRDTAAFAVALLSAAVTVILCQPTITLQQPHDDDDDDKPFCVHDSSTMVNQLRMMKTKIEAMEEAFTPLRVLNGM